MPQINSGTVLREARERKGYDLTTVARRLRIRPDILRAIESSDFSNMPPRGYARNMVNAYARFLGLNPTEIVNMYLDEAYAHQVEKARGAAPGSGFVMDGYQRRPRMRGRMARAESEGSAFDDNSRTSYFEAEQGDSYTAGSRNGRRHLYDDRTQFSHDGYGVTRDRVARSDRSDRDFLSHHSGYSTGGSQSSGGYPGYGGYGSRGSRSSRRGGRDIQVGQTPMEYSAPRIPAFVRSRPFIIGAIAVVVIVLIFIIVNVIGGSHAEQSEDVSQLPVSGISDTTGTTEEEAEEEAQVEIAPTSARVVYSVSSGDECYVELYTDGELSSSDLLSGPVQETVEVTGTWTITTWSPDTISVTVDGSEVQLAADSEYGGMYAYTVDFAKILEEWNSTHTSKSSQRQAAVASASNAAEQASSSSSEDEEEDSASAETETAESETDGA